MNFSITYTDKIEQHTTKYIINDILKILNKDLKKKGYKLSSDIIEYTPYAHTEYKCTRHYILKKTKV